MASKLNGIRLFDDFVKVNLGHGDLVCAIVVIVDDQVDGQSFPNCVESEIASGHGVGNLSSALRIPAYQGIAVSGGDVFLKNITQLSGVRLIELKNRSIGIRREGAAVGIQSQGVVVDSPVCNNAQVLSRASRNGEHRQNGFGRGGIGPAIEAVAFQCGSLQSQRQILNGEDIGVTGIIAAVKLVRDSVLIGLAPECRDGDTRLGHLGVGSNEGAVLELPAEEIVTGAGYVRRLLVQDVFTGVHGGDPRVNIGFGCPFAAVDIEGQGVGSVRPVGLEINIAGCTSGDGDRLNRSGDVKFIGGPAIEGPALIGQCGDFYGQILNGVGIGEIRANGIAGVGDIVGIDRPLCNVAEISRGHGLGQVGVRSNESLSVLTPASERVAGSLGIAGGDKVAVRNICADFHIAVHDGGTGDSARVTGNDGLVLKRAAVSVEGDGVLVGFPDADDINVLFLIALVFAMNCVRSDIIIENKGEGDRIEAGDIIDPEITMIPQSPGLEGRAGLGCRSFR